jgi:hypothetical protein
LILEKWVPKLFSCYSMLISCRFRLVLDVYVV